VIPKAIIAYVRRSILAFVTQDISQMVLLVSAGLLAGGLNALAGGGSFISFPALLICRIPPISANATSALATWPGLLSASWGYRELLRQHRGALLMMSLVSIAGGTFGGLLVLATPPEVFMRLVPFLLLFGTSLLLISCFRKGGAAATMRTTHEVAKVLPQGPLGIRSTAQLMVAVYGGYFAGGVGVLQIATLSLFGIDDMQLILGLKNLCGVLMGGASLLTLMLGGKVAWHEAVVLTAGTVSGGYLGGRVAQRINPSLMRWLVAALCVVVTAIFFSRHK